MLKISGNGIRLTRGDTIRFTIRLTGREVPDGTKTLFTVKKSAWQHGAPLISEEIPVMDNAVHVFLTPDTTNIPAGDCVWDLRVVVDGDVFTPMEYGLFRIMEAIGDE